MGSGRTVGFIAVGIVILVLAGFESLAQGCEGPGCISIDDIPTITPAQAQRPNFLTGSAVSDVSSRVIEEIDRGSKPKARRFKMRRYPVDLSQPSNVSLGFGDVIEFRLNRTKYLMEVTDLTKENMQIKILPTKEKTNLTPHETKTYDVNHDGTPDLSLTMGDVEVNQVQTAITPGANPPPQDGQGQSLVGITTMVPPSSPSIPSPQPTVYAPLTQPSDQPPVIAPQAYVPPSEGSSPLPAMPPVYSPPPEVVQTAPLIPPPESSALFPTEGIPSIPTSMPEVSSEIPAGSSSREGMGVVGWGVAIALSIIALLGILSAVVVRREHQHVDTVTDYLIESLAKKVPLPQSVQALGQAGWSRKLTDKALANLADKYKAEAMTKGADINVLRNQLASAGMPDDILKVAFK